VERRDLQVRALRARDCSRQGIEMSAFGATPPGSNYVGGGDLWGEPDPPQRKRKMEQMTFFAIVIWQLISVVMVTLSAFAFLALVAIQ